MKTYLRSICVLLVFALLSTETQAVDQFSRWSNNWTNDECIHFLFEFLIPTSLFVTTVPTAISGTSTFNHHCAKDLALLKKDLEVYRVLGEKSQMLVEYIAEMSQKYLITDDEALALLEAID